VSALAALCAGTALYLLTAGRRRRAMAQRLEAYLNPPASGPSAAAPPPRRIGEAAASQLAAAAAGAGLGALVAAGHLFIAAIPAQAPALIALGAAAGLLVHRIRRKRAAAERATRLLRELPTVADTLALAVLAGESVAGAAERFAGGARGVASDELQAALARHRSGTGLTEALTEAAASTAHPEAGRLYDLLGHAHRTGGRLADALADLAVDYRATLARDLTAEGGRRALAAYGPILALMVPVTLVFLMYPTLTGLAALSSAAP
jgi:tight adherence protein C